MLKMVTAGLLQEVQGLPFTFSQASGKDHSDLEQVKLLLTACVVVGTVGLWGNPC